MMNTPFDLNGRTYIVTGASSGIGFETCKAISQMNGKFIAIARREQNLKNLINECGDKHNYIVADLTKEEDLDRIINTIDKVDGVVHSAGEAKFIPIKFYSLEALNEQRRINVDSIFYLMNGICKKKKLNKNSSIVMVSSLGAYLGTIGGAYYGAAKSELLALSKVWANELSPGGTRVNCVAPGIVETELVAAAYERLSEEEIVADKKKYPLGYGKPEEIAYPIVFLLSDASRWITGQSIILDGGRSIYV